MINFWKWKTWWPCTMVHYALGRAQELWHDKRKYKKITPEHLWLGWHPLHSNCWVLILGNLVWSSLQCYTHHPNHHQKRWHTLLGWYRHGKTLQESRGHKLLGLPLACQGWSLDRTYQNWESHQWLGPNLQGDLLESQLVHLRERTWKLWTSFLQLEEH